MPNVAGRHQRTQDDAKFARNLAFALAGVDCKLARK
jgi:hypothetical protein